MSTLAGRTTTRARSERLASALVSVVIPTCGRVEMLERCLTALDEQDIPRELYEVLVVDDSADGTVAPVVERYASEATMDVRCVRSGPLTGPAHARNVGWRAARGGIIAFTDDDCLPAPRWLRSGVCAMVTSGGVDGAYGPIRVPLPNEPTDYERDAAGLERAEFATANCFYTRRALEEVGGFDERFTSAWREDSDLFLALLEKGRRLGFAREALVVHPVRPAEWGVSIKQQRKSMFNALLYKKHPSLYRARVQASPPWSYYAIVGALAGAAIAAVFSLGWLVLVMLCAWALLTASFCARRLRGTSRARGHVTEMVVTSMLIPPLAVYWRLRGAVRFRVVFF
ncbi:MAG TPA: glycosyltransferase [Gemmatimonadaceae bacterium]|nr:glycosyltransferase [Gemmatimonadaceae bacterium]